MRRPASERGPLLLTEADVAAALPMPDLIGTLEDAFRAKEAGQATNKPRTRVLTAGGGVLHMVSATRLRAASVTT